MQPGLMARPGVSAWHFVDGETVVDVVPVFGSGISRVARAYCDGRRLLNARNSPSTGIPAIDSEQQRIGQEIEAARLSRLFASTSIREVASSIAQAASVGVSTAVPNQASQPAQPA